MAFTVFEKIWNAHALAEREDGQTLLYIDRHLTHEVTSPLAFEGFAWLDVGLGGLTSPLR
jgi:homoaconitase/3-isopropylmalate dehydratase large subunit